MTEDAMSSLHTLMSSYSRLAPADWQKLSERLSPLTLRKNEFFISAGAPSSRMAFIVSGIFRVFCTTADGDDRTLAFRKRGHILSAFTPAIEGRTCWYSIQALEDSELQCMRLSDFAHLKEDNINWEKFYGAYVTRLFIEKEDRERSFLTEDARTRYSRFKTQHPDIEESVYDFHIASYLGISPVTLSRIRNSSEA